MTTLAIQPSKYQQDIYDFVQYGYYGQHGVVDAVAGAGKCLGKGTPVLMYDGSIKPVEDIKPGDLLMGMDSTPRKVLATTSGRDELFKIKPVKGDSWVCNSVHVLTLVNSVTNE